MAILLALTIGNARAEAVRAGWVPIEIVGQAPIKMYFEDHGPRRGEPILLLHGLGGSTHSFRHIVPTLATHSRVVTLDLRGFGRSDKPLDQNYSARDQARLVIGFMRALGLHRVTLAGHSYGGAVALVTALELQGREPSRVARLVLMNTPALPQPLSREQELLQMPVVPYVGLTVMPPIFAVRRALASERRSGPPATDADAEIYADALIPFGGKHALITSSRLIASTDAKAIAARYRSVIQPALLIWCRDDPTVPEATGRKLVRMLPNARLSILEPCTHMPAEEAPRETLDALHRFLGR